MPHAEVSQLLAVIRKLEKGREKRALCVDARALIRSIVCRRLAPVDTIQKWTRQVDRHCLQEGSATSATSTPGRKRVDVLALRENQKKALKAVRVREKIRVEGGGRERRRERQLATAEIERTRQAELALKAAAIAKVKERKMEAALQAAAKTKEQAQRAATRNAARASERAVRSQARVGKLGERIKEGRREVAARQAEPAGRATSTVIKTNQPPSTLRERAARAPVRNPISDPQDLAFVERGYKLHRDAAPARRRSSLARPQVAADSQEKPVKKGLKNTVMAFFQSVAPEQVPPPVLVPLPPAPAPMKSVRNPPAPPAAASPPSAWLGTHHLAPMPAPRRSVRLARRRSRTESLNRAAPPKTREQKVRKRRDEEAMDGPQLRPRKTRPRPNTVQTDKDGDVVMGEADAWIGAAMHPDQTDNTLPEPLWTNAAKAQYRALINYVAPRGIAAESKDALVALQQVAHQGMRLGFTSWAIPLANAVLPRLACMGFPLSRAMGMVARNVAEHVQHLAEQASYNFAKVDAGIRDGMIKLAALAPALAYATFASLGENAPRLQREAMKVLEEVQDAVASRAQGVDMRGLRGRMQRVWNKLPEKDVAVSGLLDVSRAQYDVMKAAVGAFVASAAILPTRGRLTLETAREIAEQQMGAAWDRLSKKEQKTVAQALQDVQAEPALMETAAAPRGTYQEEHAPPLAKPHSVAAVAVPQRRPDPQRTTPLPQLPQHPPIPTPESLYERLGENRRQRLLQTRPRDVLPSPARPAKHRAPSARTTMTMSDQPLLRSIDQMIERVDQMIDGARKPSRRAEEPQGNQRDLDAQVNLLRTERVRTGLENQRQDLVENFSLRPNATSQLLALNKQIEQEAEDNAKMRTAIEQAKQSEPGLLTPEEADRRNMAKFTRWRESGEPISALRFESPMPLVQNQFLTYEEDKRRRNLHEQNIDDIMQRVFSQPGPVQERVPPIALTVDHGIMGPATHQRKSEGRKSKTSRR